MAVLSSPPQGLRTPGGQDKVQGLPAVSAKIAGAGGGGATDRSERGGIPGGIGGPIRLRVRAALGALRVAGARDWLTGRVARMRGHLFESVPVCLAFGIAAWFALPWEPGAEIYAGSAALALVLALLWWRGPEGAQPLAAGLFWVMLGLLAAGARAHSVAAPMLDFRYYGPVTGRVIDLDRSQSDALRVTLDRVVLERTDPARTPARVRIALHGDRSEPAPQPGQVVMTTAHLAAPAGATEPGGFDFRRMAFFDGLGAVGYTRVPVLLWEEAAPGDQAINRLRMRMSQAIRAAIPGQAGAFAAGAMTGDRSAITEETAQALRDSSLAHILAISGMNLAFLVGFVFGLVRYGVALVPPLALRINSKKAAAVVSLAVAAFYLALSGANVATERAFLMVVVMLGAVLADRRAVTLRSVAISAVLLLLWQPESLMEPGFQMSFAATVALVAGFGAVDRALTGRRLPRWAAPAATAVLSSAIGGVATAPYAAAHFNRFADLGFVANLLTVPAMGMLIMPGGVMAALLAPLGLAAPAFGAMELGSRWILYVAARVAAAEGAVTGIVGPPAGGIAALTLGALWLVLVPGRARFAGALALAAALAAWCFAPMRPALLISGDGAIAGLDVGGGRALSAPRGAGFVAENWLQDDGDLATQVEAAARPGFDGPKEARGFHLSGWHGVLLTGTPGAADVAAACATHDLVIAAGAAGDPAWPPHPAEGGCLLLHGGLFKRTGALALDPLAAGEALRLVPADRAGRIWAAQREATGPVVLTRETR